MLNIIHLKAKHYDSACLTPCPTHAKSMAKCHSITTVTHCLYCLYIWLQPSPPPHSPPRATGWATLTPSPWCPRSSLWSRSLQGIIKLQRRLRKTLSGLALQLLRYEHSFDSLQGIDYSYKIETQKQNIAIPRKVAKLELVLFEQMPHCQSEQGLLNPYSRGAKSFIVSVNVGKFSENYCHE